MHKHSFDTHQSVTNLAVVGTRLYDSPAQAELYGYATNKVGYCRPSSSAAFRAQLTSEHDHLLCSNETLNLRQNCNIVWPSDFSPSYHVWTAELGTIRVFTHAWTWQVEHASLPPFPNYGEYAHDAWDYVTIPWRHNLGATILYFKFVIKAMFNVPWTLKIVSFPKLVMQFN